MKYTLTFFLITLMAFVMNAQTMKWIPMEPGMAKGPCVVETGKKQKDLCYALQYVPNESGVLTSYTTGFFVSCTSMGSAVSKNQSCTMINNVNLRIGCDGTGMVLMNSSGNSGTTVSSKVEAGVPIILHQVYFSIPYGESITIKEDPITDLTTSIDLVSGGSKTEYPVFEEMTIRRDRPDVSRPVWLDFKGIPAGKLIAQLDWSTSDEVDNSHFVIEHSVDGNVFTPIGKVDAVELPGRINSYQFFDKSAVLGQNYYRLQQVDLKGRIVFSPVRTVTFSEDPFSVKISPNPADKLLLVDIQSPIAESTIKLIDPTGRIVIDEKNDNKRLKTQLNIEKLIPGVYTLMVETSQNSYSEKVVIAH